MHIKYTHFCKCENIFLSPFGAIPYPVFNFDIAFFDKIINSEFKIFYTLVIIILIYILIFQVSNIVIFTISDKPFLVNLMLLICISVMLPPSSKRVITKSSYCTFCNSLSVISSMALDTCARTVSSMTVLTAGAILAR